MTLRRSARRTLTAPVPLYGPQQSRFARYLERRELRRPDLTARELRQQLLAGLRGRVLEVGCGDGRAFELYPSEVERVLAVEPDPTARARAGERARETTVPIEVVDGVADSLPAEDCAFGAVVLVWVLCGVPDPAAALHEVRRVLRPEVSCASTSTSAHGRRRSTFSSGRSTRCSGRAPSAAAGPRATRCARSRTQVSRSSRSTAASIRRRC